MDLFPSSTIQQQPTRQQQGGPGLAEKWRGWMQKPENAALLMQAGIAMLQPMQIGQSTAGAIASSIGQGFEARDRVRQNTAASQANAQKLAMEQEELGLRRDEGQAKKEYYKRLGSGGVSASSLFSRENRRHDKLQGHLLKAAETATEMIFDPDEKSAKMMELLNDQAWLDQQASAFMATDAVSERVLGGESSSATPSVPLPSAGAAIPPPPAAIERLKKNPALAGDFDEKFGAGSAARVLGGP